METIKVYALTTNGEVSGAHCPLVTEENLKTLEETFNYKVRGEQIIWIEIETRFECKDEKKKYCKNCPFNIWEPTDEEIDKSVKEMYTGAFGE